MNIPRTLLLTWWPPDIRYAGGEAIRRIVERLPPERLAWATLRPHGADFRPPCAHRSFSPRALHWRLRRTALNDYFEDLQAPRVAAAIAAWAAPFRPELIWVLPELGAAGVAQHLRRRLGVPVHATVHDAHETARFIVPRLYYPWYARRVGRVLREARSADVISAGLLKHLRERIPGWQSVDAMLFPPSIARSAVQSVAAPVPLQGGAVRRIGFCGSMRVSPEQWGRFLALLGRLPVELEVVAFAYQDLFPKMTAPPNVRLRLEPFAPAEEDVIRAFRRAGVRACYLGLWREPARRCFGRTSLSAKLVTYTAAALPVVVDGPAESAAWTLVGRHGAGILIDDDDSASLRRLSDLMSDDAAWGRMAEGARRLCLEEFDLESHVHDFIQLLGRAGR
jgi:hypothetical protein